MFSQQFTFHYVSIKTRESFIAVATVPTFTFHYVSIKTYYLHLIPQRVFHLHSTMYLLKLDSDGHYQEFITQFTFHYVSIKTHSFSQ